MCLQISWWDPLLDVAAQVLDIVRVIAWSSFKYIIETFLFIVAGLFVCEFVGIVLYTWEPSRIWANITRDTGGRQPTDFLYWVPFAPLPARPAPQNRGQLQPQGSEADARTVPAGVRPSDPQADVDHWDSSDVDVPSGTRGRPNDVRGQTQQGFVEERAGADAAFSLVRRGTNRDVSLGNPHAVVGDRRQSAAPADNAPTGAHAHTGGEVVPTNAASRVQPHIRLPQAHES